jgi:hypothetical protein
MPLIVATLLQLSQQQQHTQHKNKNATHTTPAGGDGVKKQEETDSASKDKVKKWRCSHRRLFKN